MNGATADPQPRAAPTRRWLDRYLPLALLFAGAALLAEYTPLDRWVLDAFYDPVLGAFPARRAWWAQTLLHKGQSALIVLVALLALAGWLGSFARARWRDLRRPALYLLACIALTTSAVGALKQLTARDCPWDLDVYGGQRPHLHLFAAPPAEGRPGRCFPGGHSSGAFSLLALGVLARRRPRAAGALLVGVLVLGGSYALCQWLRGAHFPSHDLWSAFVAWTVAHGLAPLLGGRAPPRTRAA